MICVGGIIFGGFVFDPTRLDLLNTSDAAGEVKSRHEGCGRMDKSMKNVTRHIGSAIN